MQTAVPLACFLSVIRPPGVQYENSLLQIAPVDKSKCPYVKDGNDVAFQLYTRHNPTVYQDLRIDDDEKLFASNIDFHDKTVLYFHAWMETPEDGSGVMVREAYMQRGDTNVIMVDARTLEAGPWYFTAAQNTWYIGRFAGRFIDYLVSRGLNLNNTHLVGHSLGAHVAGVAGSALQSGRVARITGLDAALPLFENLPLQQRLDQTDAKFVDIIHTDAGIFGYKVPMGHVDFYPNAGISPQPGCELEVVIPKQLLLNKCDARAQTNGFYTYYLKGNGESHLNTNSLEYKLEKLFAFIQSVKSINKEKDSSVTLDKVRDNIDSLYYFKDSIVDYMKDYEETKTDASKNETDDDEVKEYVEDKEVNKAENNMKALIEDQIAEESDTSKADDVIEKYTLFKEETFEVHRTKRALDQENEGVKELTVESGNLTIAKEIAYDNGKKFKLKQEENEDAAVKVTTENKLHKNGAINNVPINTAMKVEKEIISPENIDIKAVSLTPKQVKPIIKNITSHKKKGGKATRFDLFRPRPILRTVIRMIPMIINRSVSKQKIPKLGIFRTDREKSNKSKRPKFTPFRNPKIDSKPNPKILKRNKRFLPFFQRSEDSNNILFRMLDFLIKNRKNVLPVFTVMREINTLVKSANGELNHYSKESNNYIGATPPTFTPITYSLELGNENRAVAFVKKLFGVIPKGDRLTISGTGK